MHQTFLRAERNAFQEALGSFVQVDEDEWKAFLEELTQFEKKYELILTRLDAAENMLHDLRKVGKHITCTHCGFKIARPARFCPRCGADFEKLTCSCGRELSSTARFCDRCGKVVGDRR